MVRLIPSNMGRVYLGYGEDAAPCDKTMLSCTWRDRRDRDGPRRRRGNRVIGMARFRAVRPFLPARAPALLPQRIGLEYSAAWHLIRIRRERQYHDENHPTRYLLLSDSLAAAGAHVD